MFKWIKKLLLKSQLKNLNEQEISLNEKRAKLVYKPPMNEIPKRLKKCSEIAKELKKIEKKRNKINKILNGRTKQNTLKEV